MAHDPPEWQGPVAARWTIVAQYERDGEHYLVARRRDLTSFARDRLPERELEVVRQLGRGLTTKEIAFELGISASTAGVLLWRAAAKLNVRGRRELREIGAALERQDTLRAQEQRDAALR
jgi:DNA-binding NarL/FixJ family response regulator